MATTAKADGNDDVVKIEAAARAAAAAMATAKVNARGELCEKRDSGGDADGSIVGRVEGDARGRLSSADRIRLSRVPADASWSPLTTGATGSEHELFPRLTHHIRDSDRNDNDTMERPTSAPAPGSSSRSSRKPREVDSVKTRGRGIGDHRADARPTSAPKLERGTGSLSVAVRGVLGTTNGLENLRSSLQGTGSGSGALEIAAMSRLASMASMSNSVNKKASVFGGLVHSLMDTSTNVRDLSRVCVSMTEEIVLMLERGSKYELINHDALSHLMSFIVLLKPLSWLPLSSSCHCCLYHLLCPL